MKKEAIMPVAVLTVICVVVAALMGLVNSFTAPKIEADNIEAIKKSLSIVLPEGDFPPEPDELRDDAPDTIKQIYTDNNGKGWVVVLETTGGYTGKPIGITAAIGPDGKIIKTVVTRNEESIVPDELKPMGSYGDHYAGKDAYETVDLVTGATVKYTEAAIKNALYDAFFYLGFASDRVLDGAHELMPNVKEFIDVTPRRTKPTVSRILEAADGSGHVVCAVTKSSHSGAPETETVIAIDNTGTIIGVKNILWSVGHNLAYGPPAPPSEEAVNAFFQSFVGKNVNEINSVEHITDATGTSNNVKAAFEDALRFNESTEMHPIFRVLGITVIVGGLGGLVAYLIISRKRRTAE